MAWGGGGERASGAGARGAWGAPRAHRAAVAQVLSPIKKKLKGRVLLFVKEKRLAYYEKKCAPPAQSDGRVGSSWARPLGDSPL